LKQERIEREGYFCTGMGDSLTRGSRRRMFEFFNTTMETFFGKPMSAGGVHGATYWGGGYEAVIKYSQLQFTHPTTSQLTLSLSFLQISIYLY
jgi:hypothetical protein